MDEKPEVLKTGRVVRQGGSRHWNTKEIKEGGHGLFLGGLPKGQQRAKKRAAWKSEGLG